MLLTEWNEFVNVDPAELSAAVARKRIFDGRNVLDHETWNAAGWDIVSAGHKSELLDLAAAN
jgi:UDPglucose 6-dehydrogenase